MIVAVNISAYCENLEDVWENINRSEELYEIYCLDTNDPHLSPIISGFHLDFENFNRFGGNKYLMTDPIDKDFIHPEFARKYNLSMRVTGENLYKMLFRTTADLNENWKIGVVDESDSGEKWNDYYSGYIWKYKIIRGLRGDDICSNFVLGNYAAGYGQGLGLWRGYDWGGYAESPIAQTKHDFLRGSVSALENGSLFGTAYYGQEKRCSYMTGYSNIRWDANVDSNGVTSLNTSGLHNTPAGREDENRMREQLAFGRFNYFLTEDFHFGISASYAHYDPAFAKSDSIRDTFGFKGNENIVACTDFFYEYDELILSSEYGRNIDNGQGIIANFKYQSNFNVSTAVSYHNFSRNFRNLRSLYPDGNDEGFSYGFSAKLGKYNKLNLLYETSAKPWRTYYDETPPEKDSKSVNFERNTGYMNSLSMRIKQSIVDSGNENAINNQFRFTCRHWLHRSKYFPFYGFDARAEIMQYVGESYVENGWLLSLTPYYFPVKKLLFTLTAFHVPSYNSRIYMYENDVPGKLSIPFYYGNGAAVNAVYTLNWESGFSFAVKAGMTHYDTQSGQPDNRNVRDFSLYFCYKN